MKTQEERLRYILNGGTLRNRKSGEIVGLKDGMIDFTGDRGSSYMFNANGWEPYIEPLKVEFECEWGIAETGGITYPFSYPPYEILDHIQTMVGKGRFKVTGEQIIEESK